MTMIWNEQAAAHLFRRAGFGASRSEILGAVRNGLEATVDDLVNYETTSNDDLDRRLEGMPSPLVELTSDPENGIRWALARMIYTARPLEERMVFFLHNHFATSWTKFQAPAYLVLQNITLRTHATGNFRRLLLAMAQDPAMMFWLDNNTNVKDHPNENFARELLELFSLGRGHYAESDVLAAARAFTGWTNAAPPGATHQQFRFNDEQHDHGAKSFMGETGDLGGEDVIRIICGKFDHARFIAGKLFAYFAYDNPEPAVVDRFARIYADQDTQLKPLLTAILTSDEMYSERALWSRVKSPIDRAVMAHRLLRLDRETEGLTTSLRAQGQIPFEPPSVKGWPSGTTWITANALLQRFNLANREVLDFDPLSFGTAGTAEQYVDLYLTQLDVPPLAPEVRDGLLRYLAPSGTLPQGISFLSRLRGLAHLVLSLPEWQVM